MENPEEGYKSTINAILGQPSENESVMESLKRQSDMLLKQV